jgi:hypothetical protein
VERISERYVMRRERGESFQHHKAHRKPMARTVGSRAGACQSEDRFCFSDWGIRANTALMISALECR